ncbi:SDR family oxidoreductase [Erythrobacter sp. JK5]|uniref:SDR family oxidoreductase n=1 Tax=Erythrobacter sp. JK5 TaxID=2829500 RepID=UPI001BA78B3F|nr:SDR family oxidoreductase [Erythrobacter sp. JK5]QUL38762.1 SDR family oxidoreductase [Erythrobacter sp. JK5]
MPDLNRRALLAGAAATGALAATASLAQPDTLTATPDLSGRSILITGCSSGFGRLMAEHFARMGATVFATMRGTPRPEAAELVQIAERDGLDLHVLRLDVTRQDEVDEAVAQAERIAGGAIDVLVNNAGISFGGPIEIQDMEATRLTFDTNVFGPHRMARAVLPAMRAAKSGLIVNISSQLGRVIAPSYGQYSPTKFALEAMSEGLAYELVPHEIDVTVIEPGGYPTMIWKNANANSLELVARADQKHLSGYPELVERLGTRTGGGTTDPMDVPRAIAQVIAMTPGTRPLRRPVHPGPKPQIPINELTAKVQVDWLGNSAFGPWVKAVHNA